MTVIPFATDELIVAMNPEHPLASKENISIHDLKNLEFIAFEKDIPTRKATDEILKNAEIEVSIVMEFDNVETVKRAWKSMPVSQSYLKILYLMKRIENN